MITEELNSSCLFQTERDLTSISPAKAKKRLFYRFFEYVVGDHVHMHSGYISGTKLRRAMKFHIRSPPPPRPLGNVYVVS